MTIPQWPLWENDSNDTTGRVHHWFQVLRQPANPYPVAPLVRPILPSQKFQWEPENHPFKYRIISFSFIFHLNTPYLLAWVQLAASPSLGKCGNWGVDPQIPRRSWWKRWTAMLRMLDVATGWFTGFLLGEGLDIVWVVWEGFFLLLGYSFWCFWVGLSVFVEDSQWKLA